MAESMAEFVARRRREREQFARNPEAVAYEAYGRATRAGQDLRLVQPRDVAAHGAELLSEADRARPLRRPQDAVAAKSRWAEHPGLAESLVPVWGSGREAVADIHDGDYSGATLNGALAASDLFLGSALVKAATKGGGYALKGAIGKKASQAIWTKVRKDMGEAGLLAKYQPGHHWFIPRNGWGKAVPDVIKNHPANIHGMPNAEVHGRMHGRYKDKPAFSPVERYVYGTPAWSKAATGSAVGHPVAADKARREGR